MHFLQGGDSAALCLFLNSITFGFEVKIHWTLRILISVLVIPTMPLILYVFFSCLMIAIIYGLDNIMDPKYACLACCDRPQNKCLYYLFNLVLLPFRITVFLTIVAVIFSLFTIPTILLAPIYYLLLLLVLFRILCRWICCCGSKRGGEVNEQLLAEYKKKNRRIIGKRYLDNRV